MLYSLSQERKREQEVERAISSILLNYCIGLQLWDKRRELERGESKNKLLCCNWQKVCYFSVLCECVSVPSRWEEGPRPTAR